VGADVDNMQPAARAQNTVNLGYRTGFHVFVQMVQHHRRQHPIEFAIRIGKLLRISTLELNSRHSTSFSLRPSKGERIGITASQVHPRVGTLGADGDVAGATTDF
jgi:hypothetical protein